MNRVALVLKAKELLEGDYQKLREDWKKTEPVTRTKEQTRYLVGGAKIYIERILASENKEDIDEDLYWALMYLFAVVDEKKYNLDLDNFKDVIDRLAHKYRPEICIKHG